MKIIASIEDPAVIKIILDHLEKNTAQPATRALPPAARAPPQVVPAGLTTRCFSLPSWAADAESFMTPAEELSCRRQTNPENTSKIAASRTVPTLDPLTDKAISGGDPFRWAPVLTRRLTRELVYTSYTRGPLFQNAITLEPALVLSFLIARYTDLAGDCR